VDVGEHRGIVSLLGKAALPAEVLLEFCARADLRWMDDDHSSRYRFRIEFMREFTAPQHKVVSFFNAEWFYDTRHDGWAGTLATLGLEVAVNPHLRYHVHPGRQTYRLPRESDLNVLGVNFMWHH
jgi:hypothetical protein